jgi:hypothetical protein
MWAGACGFSLARTCFVFKILIQNGKKQTGLQVLGKRGGLSVFSL